MKVYDLKELAELLKMNIRTLQRYVREGKLKASKVGTHYIITETDLNEFLKANIKEVKKEIVDARIIASKGNMQVVTKLDLKQLELNKDALKRKIVLSLLKYLTNYENIVNENKIILDLELDGVKILKDTGIPEKHLTLEKIKETIEEALKNVSEIVFSIKKNNIQINMLLITEYVYFDNTHIQITLNKDVVDLFNKNEYLELDLDQITPSKK